MSHGIHKFNWNGSTTGSERKYDSLQDAALARYFSRSQTRNILVHSGLVAKDGRIVKPSRGFSRIAVVEQEFQAAERLEEIRQQEEAKLRMRLQRQAEDSLSRFNTYKKVQRMRNKERRSLQERKAERERLEYLSGAPAVWCRRQSFSRQQDDETSRPATSASTRLRAGRLVGSKSMTQDVPVLDWDAIMKEDPSRVCVTRTVKPVELTLDSFVSANNGTRRESSCTPGEHTSDTGCSPVTDRSSTPGSSVQSSPRSSMSSGS